MTIFDERTLQECADSLAIYHPNGKLFRAKNLSDKNYRKFIEGLSVEYCRVQDLLITYMDQILPDQTTILIEEWEKAVGIPDSCLEGEGDGTRPVANRRRDILLKLAASGLQTAQDFIEFAKIFGFVDPDPGEITVGRGPGGYNIIINFPASDSEVFPFTFPITFGTETRAILECLFTKLKPANCTISFP